MVKDDRGLLLKTKLMMPERAWRAMTRPAAAALRLTPDSLKYSVGLRVRRHHMPYAAVEPTSLVVQVGAPADLLSVGRSRAAFFLHLVSNGGRVLVLEPVPQNCERLRAFAERNGLSDRLVVVEAGAWSETRELKFYESEAHPASAVLADLCKATPQEMARRGYREMTIPVTTVDAVLAEHRLPLPKLVSITTNGAEVETLAGMKDTIAAGGAEYVSLAMTGHEYEGKMRELGYRHLAHDDRGFTFVRAQ